MAVTADNSLSLWSSRGIPMFQSVLQTPVLVHIISDRFKKISTDFILYIGDQRSQSPEKSQPTSGACTIAGLFLFTFIAV